VRIEDVLCDWEYAMERGVSSEVAGALLVLAANLPACTPSAEMLGHEFGCALTHVLAHQTVSVNGTLEVNQ
jgi:hypothetical protein